MTRVRIPLLSFFVFLSVLSGLISCRKSSNGSTTNTTNTTVTTPSDSIKVATFYARLNNKISLAAVGDTVYFIGWVEEAARKNPNVYYATFFAQGFHWDFGDGDTSNYSIPYQTYFTRPFHIYTLAGNYQVHMTANDTINATPVNITICKDPLFTKYICQNRVWHGGTEQVIAGSGVLSTRNIPDTMFSLIYIDKVALSLFGNNFTYNVSSSDSMLTYTGLTYSETVPNFLQYFPGNDSISLMLYVWVPAGLGTAPLMNLYTFHSP